MTFDEQVAVTVYLRGTLADAAFSEIAHRLNYVVVPCAEPLLHRFDENVTEAMRKIYCTPYAGMAPDALYAESRCYVAHRCSACGKVRASLTFQGGD